MYFSKSSAFLVAALVVLVAAITVAEGQTTPSCAAELIPCADFLNSTSQSPPATCCDPLKAAMTQQRACLCNLYNTPGLLPSLGINVTQAVLLPGRCGIPDNLSACSNASSSSPPPASGNDSHSSRGITCSGLPALFLFWASMVLY